MLRDELHDDRHRQRLREPEADADHEREQRERRVTAVELAEATGISRGTARRYLEYLALTGAVELSLRYGTTGRPEHRYRWADRLHA